MTTNQHKLILQRTTKAALIRDETTAPRAVRLWGRLATISTDHSDLVLTLANGDEVAARLAEQDPHLLKSLLGHGVLVSGIARFEPSGQLLLIEIEYLAKAEEADLLFSKVPDGRASRPLEPVAAAEKGDGVAAFFGTWPGEETEAALLAALAALD